ncbi:MAG: hypothetical protein KC421_18735 [Anaerolineales bacterium]|nr:hypothetical protein [Anaerolineales bacterium]
MKELPHPYIIYIDKRAVNGRCHQLTLSNRLNANRYPMTQGCSAGNSQNWIEDDPAHVRQ